ncbi:MAG TPA: SO2930 family diheme c-type cytochrome [Kofleriaceae bacterium]|nr:SO2930 family diheme c-type cytochrome [Kofleriaceae bacterium]
MNAKVPPAFLALLATWRFLPACGDNSSHGLPDASPETEALSSYDFFEPGSATQPRPGVIPFDLNTPLFSDHASKYRFVSLPEGESMTYTDDGIFEMPVGTTIIKSFGFERIVETRLLTRGDDGWEGLVFVWDEERGDAFLQRAGGIVPVNWKDADGDAHPLDYIVPSTGQCTGCHVGDGAEPIGLQARHLNKGDQLARLTDLGVLTGTPANPSDIPRTPVWDDPDTGTVEERARAWLDVNCAHCHSPTGPARTSGLDLRTAQTDPASYGVCKTTVAAGTGSGGLTYDIVPGDPEASILVHRMASVEPAVRMPELLRQTVHQESLVLVSEWISAMNGACDPPE